ncbi:MAG: hypothetical protein RIA63_06380, partial [Cyclobacteriaceae bacterium]
YALYLPKDYNSEKKWPVILIFEPAARGKLPVQKFKQGADELGYILMASNNSKNGGWEIAFEAADAMFADAFAKYSIDTTRMYTSGFSGGSRVASAVASLTGRVNGVIACGAGFAGSLSYQLPAKSPVYYASVVGNQDMNYQELRYTEKALDGKSVSNTRIIFNAGHQWPNAKYLMEALYWMELQCLKDNKAVSDNFSVEKAYSIMKDRADSTLNAGNLVLAREIYEGMVDDYNSLRNIKELEEKIQQINLDKEYKKQVKRFDKYNALEVKYRQELSDAFTELTQNKLKTYNDSLVKDMRWWEKTVDSYKKMSTKDDFIVSNMASRILNQIGAQSAETSFGCVSTKDYETALKLARIWYYLSPGVMAKWQMVVTLAYSHNDEFYTYLEELVAMGARVNKNSILKNDAFIDYLESEKMQRILAQLP